MAMNRRLCTRPEVPQVCSRVTQAIRCFSETPWRAEDAQRELEMHSVANRAQATEIQSKAEARKLYNRPPVGSRRSRMALNSSIGLPFEQLPYQCFQEARKVLRDDREKKLQQIATERKRIATVQARSAADFGGEQNKQHKLRAMQKYLEQLKVYADINDPMILRRFEDGLGDMNKPIYRHLAEKKWQEYKRKILVQRVETMHIVPDLIPHLDITADLAIAFGKHNAQPGAFVDSAISEQLPHLTVQVYDQGERNVTIALVDADVPNVEKDGFDFRCHYLATNITIGPTSPKIILKRLADSHVVHPWMPPHAQKGAPYHRLALFVLEQPNGTVLNIQDVLDRYPQRLGFNLRSLIGKYRLKPTTAGLFRSIWDENTKLVMERNGLEGSDVEFKPMKPVAQHWKYKVKDGDRYR